MNDPKVLFGFDDWNDIVAQFGGSPEPEPALIYAVYSQPPYAGDAEVIFYRDGEWYHHSGSHCSCFGLEESGWHPEKIDPHIHLKAIEEGRRMYSPCGHEGEYPQATQEAFDEWLKRAVAETQG